MLTFSTCHTSSPRAADCLYPIGWPPILIDRKQGGVSQSREGQRVPICVFDDSLFDAPLGGGRPIRGLRPCTRAAPLAFCGLARGEPRTGKAPGQSSGIKKYAANHPALRLLTSCLDSEAVTFYDANQSRQNTMKKVLRKLEEEKRNSSR